MKYSEMKQIVFFWNCWEALGGDSLLLKTKKPQNRAQHLLCAGHAIHLHKHTGELVKSRKHVYWESRECSSSECSYLFLKIPEEPPKMIAYVNDVRFMISKEEDLALGPDTRLDHLRAFV